MSDTFAMLLANTTPHNVTWEVTPQGSEPILITQLGNQYGAISVPFAPSYEVCVKVDGRRHCTDPIHAPNTLVVWDGGGLHGLSSASPAGAV